MQALANDEMVPVRDYPPLLFGGTMKITVAILALLMLAMGTGVAMVASVHKEPVLLACGGPNC
jgi:hypothetical protein